MSPEPWWVAPAVIAALVAAAVAIVGQIVQGRRARSDRHRELFANAFGDIAAYCEFPYVVRRRRADEAAAERQRISTELSAVQQRLNHNRAVLTVEAPRVARAYAELVDATRRIAGPAISQGWDRPAISDDTGIHVTDVDLSTLEPYQAAFLTAAADHLALIPWWVLAGWRRFVRWATARLWRLVSPRAASRPTEAS